MGTESTQKNAFKRLLTISSLTKLADLLVSPKTTLPFVLTSAGAPGWIISALVPVKESGSLIPQWLLKKYVSRHFENRTLLWRIGDLIQGAGVLLMVALMLLLEGSVMAYSILAVLMIVAFGRSICSLTMKDIQAETVKKGYRGRLIGLASSISGGLTLASAAIFIWTDYSLTLELAYALLAIGGVLFLVAIIFSVALEVKYQVKEDPEFRSNHFCTVIKSEKNLRQLIISRVLLLHASLIIPFVVAASTRSSENSQLAYFIGISAFASLVSSYIWGKMADRGAVFTLQVAAAICLGAALAVGFGVGAWGPNINLLLFFVLTMGYAGIRTGRKTYLLDITRQSNRTGYVAAANTVVGVSLLSLGALYALFFSFLQDKIIFIMSGLILLGLLHTFMLEKEK